MTQTSAPTEQSVIKASTPGDLLALLPYVIGFHPRDSLVVLEMRRLPGRGSTSRTGPVVRNDLPPATDPETLTLAFAEAVAGVVRQARPYSQFHLIAYDPEARSERAELLPGERARAALDHVASELGRAGLDVAERILVSDGRWRSLSCRRRCCPPHGTPLPVDDRVAAEAVGLGMTAAADRAAALPDTSPVGEDRLAAVARARAELEERPGVEVTVAAWEAELEGRIAQLGSTLPEPGWCALVLAGIADVEVRDEVLLSGERAGRVHGRAGAVAAAALAVDLARHASRAEAGQEAEQEAGQAWAVAAWLEWHARRGLRARECAETALRADPGHRLAVLVLTAVLNGLLATSVPAPAPVTSPVSAPASAVERPDRRP